jgi:quinolinate synthase
VIAHPECPPNLLDHADHIGSTSSLLKFTSDDAAEEFIVLTEPGIIHQMELKNPNKKFYQVGGTQGGCEHCNACPYMKLNTLEKLYLAMKNRAPEIKLDESTRLAAKKSLDKMLEMSA